jgi:hypothetical protein
MDLFSGGCATLNADFRWSVAMFRGSGATEAIKKANQVPLKTYYPLKMNRFGDFTPLWRNYLVIEYVQNTTIDVCRSAQNFIKMLTMRDDEGNNYPILVRKEAISENMRLLRLGKFDEKPLIRPFYGRGSIVRVVEGTFHDKKVRLEMDVAPHLDGNSKVMININGLRGSIDLWKLQL